MAKYTIELREFVNNPNINIFDFDYPFYDENEKENFQNLFIQHFYFREICAETVGRWKIYLNDFFNTHIEKYNMQALTAKIEYDLAINYDITEESTKEIEGNGKQDTTLTNSQTNTFSNEENIVANNTQSQTTENTGTGTETIDHRKIEPSQSEFASANLDKWATEVDKTTDSKTEHGETETEITTNNTQDNTATGENNQSGNTVGNLLSESAQTETFSKRVFGDMSVRTMPEAIQTHLKVQDILTTINLQFFDLAEILFLQIY